MQTNKNGIPFKTKKKLNLKFRLLNKLRRYVILNKLKKRKILK